jgi:hypothetical protein
MVMLQRKWGMHHPQRGNGMPRSGKRIGAWPKVEGAGLGGPAFDKNGNFIGIISNGNGGFTNISSSENIKQMIEDLKK